MFIMRPGVYTRASRYHKISYRGSRNGSHDLKHTYLKINGNKRRGKNNQFNRLFFRTFAE